MKNSEKALACFDNDYNCSQAVLSVFSGKYGLSRELALKIGTGFGAGVGHCGDLCEAVIGSVMVTVIGLQYGMVDSKDQGPKEKSYTMVREFNKRFETAHSSIICKEILGIDISEPAGKEKAIEKNLLILFAATA
jgi:C_GCAxxG_C_C family probable redox protein